MILWRMIIVKHCNNYYSLITSEYYTLLAEKMILSIITACKKINVNSNRLQTIIVTVCHTDTQINTIFD